MTPEELRAARIIEARRRAYEKFREDGLSRMGEMEHLADLYESNWTHPEPEVDPDLAAARVWCAERWGGHDNYLPGKHDASPEIRAYLAGCTRGREGTEGLVEALEAVVERHALVTPEFSAARAALASAKRGG